MCHSTKRTHRLFAGFLVYPIGIQLVRKFGVRLFRWVRFGKRTHRRVILGAGSVAPISKSGRVAGLRLQNEPTGKGFAARTTSRRLAPLVLRSA
jgi:hypothetical protein